MKILKLKCVSNERNVYNPYSLGNEGLKDIKKTISKLTVGETYTATNFSYGYYYIHELKIVVPIELFITLDQWRESKIDDLLN